MTSVGYYPGCSLTGSAGEFDRSLRAAAARLGVELREVPEWVCCGASSAHALDHDAALCLAADTLAKAHRAGLGAVLAPCAMCYSRLATAAQAFAEKPALAARVAEALGEGVEAITSVRPLNLLRFLSALPEGALAGAVSRPLAGLKVACYYGCLLVRPPKVTGAAEVEAPREMEALVGALGAQPVRWSMSGECCGGSFGLSRTSVVVRQGLRIYDAARKAGADVVCMACPMCHANLDMRQRQYASEGGPLPMVYLTQLLGLAMGMEEPALGLDRHFVPVAPALAARASAAGAVATR